MFKLKLQKLFVSLVLLSLLTDCGTGNSDVSPCIDTPLLLSLSQDKQLGAQVAAQIDGDPTTYPLLDSASNVEVYKYLYDMRDIILASSKIQHKNDFTWRLRVIKDDNTLNAFCTPGGYIYIYTGIIKFLDSPDDLAGVLGHEMGHADLRHSAKQLQNEQGMQFLVNILSGGNPSGLVTIANNLRGLKNSRCHETQADEASVSYLNSTIYKCNGAASFFAKIQALGSSSKPPVFLSTHPGDQARIDNINTKATTLGCNTSSSGASLSDFTTFKSKLP
jgi:beta-barrel assembly-enhancing protease